MWLQLLFEGACLAYETYTSQTASRGPTVTQEPHFFLPHNQYNLKCGLLS